jgi:LPXTG-motif cell wall-anchored protein
MKSCSNSDGLVNYEVAYGVNPVMPNLQEGFMNADGGIDYENLGDVKDIYAVNDDNFYAAEGIDYENLGDTSDIYALNDDNFYAANGRRARRRGGLGEKILSYTPAGWIKKGIDNATSPEAKKGRQERRRMRAQAKLENAKAQKLSAKAMGAGATSDAALAQALSSGNAQPTQTGMPKTTKTLLVVGGVVVLGVVGFMLYKKYKK